jgi:hypothetical protein
MFAPNLCKIGKNVVTFGRRLLLVFCVSANRLQATTFNLKLYSFAL